MKRTIRVTLFGLLSAASVAAQTTGPANAPKVKTPRPAAATATQASKKMPSVKQIIDKYVKAIGGSAAVKKINSRVSKGTMEFTAMGAKGTVELYQQAPNKTAAVINLPGLGVLQSGFNGTTGWAQDPFQGLREQSGTELLDAKRNAEFYRDIELARIYPKMVLMGTEKVGARDAYVIEATPADGGAPSKFYFDTESGLLVRLDMTSETPQGKIPTQSYFEDYRVVDGVKVAFIGRTSLGTTSLITTLTEVRHNVPVDAAKFEKPVAAATK